MRLHSTRTLVLIAVFAVLLAAAGEEARRASGQDRPARDRQLDERAVRLEEMKEIASSFKVVAIDEQGNEVQATRTDEPQHRWTDPTRDFAGGALWVWKASGRPVAVIGMELYASWSLEFVSVSPGKVRATDGEVRWTPRQPGAEFKEIAAAPVPAAGAAERLRQIRELAKRFAAREYWNGTAQHYALRLLPHPIDRYSDAAHGVVDGALFVYANGTNPEALLLIEARRTGDDAPKWAFAAAPFSHAEVKLQLGDNDVWTTPNKDSGRAPGPNETYYDAFVSRRSPAAGALRTRKGAEGH